MLPYATHAAKKTQINQVVYSQLAVETVGGNAHHLIKQHEDDTNVYGSWNTLCEWYSEDDLKNETSDNLRYKLESYRIKSVYNS